MAEKSGTLESIAREIGKSLAPLRAYLQAGQIRELFRELGMEFPAELDTVSALNAALSTTFDAADNLPTDLTELLSAVQSEDMAAIAAEVSDMSVTVLAVKNGIDDIKTQVDSLSASTLNPGNDPDGIQAADITAFGTNLAKRLLDYTVIVFLERHHPVSLNLLTLAGIVEYTELTGDEDLDKLPSYLERKLNLARLPEYLQDPGGLFEEIYDWGQPTFDGELLIEHIYGIMASMALPARHVPPDAPNLASIEFLYGSLSAINEVIGSETYNGLVLEFNAEIPLGVHGTPFAFDKWDVTLDVDTEWAAGTKVYILSDRGIEIDTPLLEVFGEVALGVIRKPGDGEDTVLIAGRTGSSRLEAGEIKLSLPTSFNWDSGSNVATGDYGFRLEVNRGYVVIEASEGDSFVSSLLPPDGIRASFDLVAGWSSESGWFFGASGSLETSLDLHKKLAGIDLKSLLLKLGTNTGGNGSLLPEIGLNAGIELGALAGVLEGIGVKLPITFPSGQDGNLGPIDISALFRPPTGLGLSIDSEGFKGGGYLSFDRDKGEYAGALELMLFDKIALKAIGILNTKLPGGEKGFSLLIIITAEFTPIQLGFGFTLNGVGGLLGLHRTMRLEKLRDGVRTNAIAGILFPEDPVANAPAIISDMKDFFPIQKGQFVFGPMLKIGWGTPTLITVDFGLLIEIPNPVRIAILGVVRAILPDEDAAILKLQINFLGTIDFEKKLITFDASLYESKLLTFAISGDMAFRLAWGDNPAFVLTVGGFHPAFKPPPLQLPALRRLTLAIIDSSNLKLTLTNYFALTSNTVQIGARVDLYASAAGFTVIGYVGFDALFQFSPFYFIFSFGAMLALKKGSKTLFSVFVDGEVQGPTPWKVKASAGFKILFVKIKFRFDKTFGEQQSIEYTPIDVYVKVVEPAFQEAGHYETELAGNAQRLVALREVDSEDLVLEASGSLSFRQKAVPLNMQLQKYGHRSVSGAKKFTITAVHIGSSSFSGSSLTRERDYFAVSEYKKLSDAKKLSAPSFELFENGVTVKPGNTGFAFNDYIARREIVFDEVRLDYNPVLTFKQFINSDHSLFTMVAGEPDDDQLFRGWLADSSAAQSPLSAASNPHRLDESERVKVAQERWVLVNSDKLTAYDADSTAFTQTEAEEYMEQVTQQDRSLQGRLLVVPEYCCAV